jgi:PKD repeat protein
MRKTFLHLKQFYPAILFIAMIINTSFHAAAQPHAKSKVLFIGNSYTYVNNLPLVAYNAAASAGDTLVYDSNAIGSYTLELHSQNATTLSKIAQGTWDYVVLQEQSQLPSFPDAQVDTEVFPYAKRLDSLVHHYNSCATSMFYMTWGKEYGDTDNCASWPPVCTYDGCDSLLHLRYMMMADSNAAVVSPVGAVWHYIRANYPAINLYQADQSHPTEAGTYAAACCFYTAIFEKSPLNISYNFTLSATDAANIRQAVKTVVFDSMAHWHIGQYDPTAGFTHTVNGGQVAFNNTSTNAITYSWNFGDGQTATTANPNHTYAASGTYTVTLTAKLCDRLTTFTDTVSVITNSVQNISRNNAFTVWPNPAGEKLHVNSSLFSTGRYALEITNVVGQHMMSAINTASERQEINTAKLKPGIYIISIIQDGQTIYRQRFQKI